MSDVVPFGKYKGQPVALLAQDRQYVEWLTAQSWFKDRYQSIYNVVINNFQEPTETPEHNAFQVRFLDETFRARFLLFLFGRDFEETSVNFEQDGFDVRLKGYWKVPLDSGGCYQNSRSCHVEIKPSVADDYPAVLRQIKAARVAPVVSYGCGKTHYDQQRSVETVVLFLGQYAGVGATEEQFIAFFESEDIKVIFLDEVT